jgi:hypothetical protein
MAAPKRKRYNKKQRLAAAEKWIPKYEGENLVKGYSKWFGVDKICAINELELLGHEIDSEYKEQIYKLEIEKEDAKKANFDDPGDFEVEHFNTWQDSDYYFIAGYTSGGVPYGITWEEYEREYKEDEEFDDSSSNDEDNDFDLPF